MIPRAIHRLDECDPLQLFLGPSFAIDGNPLMLDALAIQQVVRGDGSDNRQIRRRRS